jgi:hypothetical protein
MKSIITTTGVQAVAFILMAQVKIINAQSAAGAADWRLRVQ